MGQACVAFSFLVETELASQAVAIGGLEARGKSLDRLVRPLDRSVSIGLIDLIADDTISGRIAKDVFAEMFDSGKDAAAIVEEKGLKQITDSGAIESLIDQLIADNPEQAEQYRQGNTKVAGWFTGQAMKATQGQANPQMVNQILQDKLGG